MDCAKLQDELIAYHFATLSSSLRDQVDEHLLSCAGCLRAYLRLKHILDAASDPLAETGPHLEGEKEGPRPSEGARRRLFAEVEKTFGQKSQSRMMQLLSLRIPLYQGATAMAVLLLLYFMIPALGPYLRQPARPPLGLPGQVDSAQQLSTNVRIY